MNELTEEELGITTLQLPKENGSQYSNRSEQPLPSIYGVEQPVSEPKEMPPSQDERFMKTDELIDLFSIDPDTGRAKYSEEGML